MSDRKECGASGVHVEAPWPCERKPGHEGPHMACGTTWEDAPTAPREREMSALDQQVAEERAAVVNGWLKTARDGHRPTHRSIHDTVDALLTTHRRQVLEEVWGLMMDAVKPGHSPDWSGFVDAVASLRDTKENV